MAASWARAQGKADRAHVRAVKSRAAAFSQQHYVSGAFQADLRCEWPIFITQMCASIVYRVCWTKRPDKLFIAGPRVFCWHALYVAITTFSFCHTACAETLQPKTRQQQMQHLLLRPEPRVIFEVDCAWQYLVRSTCSLSIGISVGTTFFVFHCVQELFIP